MGPWNRRVIKRRNYKDNVGPGVRCLLSSFQHFPLLKWSLLSITHDSQSGTECPEKTPSFLDVIWTRTTDVSAAAEMTLNRDPGDLGGPPSLGPYSKAAATSNDPTAQRPLGFVQDAVVNNVSLKRHVAMAGPIHTSVGKLK